LLQTNNEMKKKKEPTKEEEEDNNICLQFVDSIEKKLRTRNNNNIFISITDYTSFIIDGINIDILIRKYDNIYE
jgi:hypothetical protein